jgi:hypothetical protein
VTTVTIVYALLAALCNALNVITQHPASISGPERSTGWHFVSYADTLHVTIGSLAFAALCAAVAVLTRTAPPTMSS